jgi:hypothetical protein
MLKIIIPMHLLIQEHSASFMLAFIETSNHDIKNDLVQETLAQRALSDPAHIVYGVRGAVQLILHRLSGKNASGDGSVTLLDLLSKIVTAAKSNLPREQFLTLQELLFVEIGPIRDLCLSRDLDQTTFEGEYPVFPSRLLIILSYQALPNLWLPASTLSVILTRV